MNMNSGAHAVVALNFSGMGIFEYACAAEVFGMARTAAGAFYRVAACAIEAGPVVTQGGIRLDAPHDLSLLDQADTILIPGWREPDERPPAALLMKLRQAHMRGARICSLCSGAFVLGWAGLLDGKSATTHWRLVDDFRRLFPKVRIEPDALFVDSGQLHTSAGSSAALDLLLHLVEIDLGGVAAQAIARRLLILPHRVGGQAQFAEALPLPRAPSRDRLAQLMDDVGRAPQLPHTASSLARRAAMSQRTLQRLFVARTGQTPLLWLQGLRVERARQLLTQPGQALSHLGEQVGFSSEESFRRHFRRILGVSPGQYRRAFQLSEAATARPAPALPLREAAQDAARPALLAPNG